MPHIIVKIWPGNTETQKQELTDAIAQDVCKILKSSDKSVSVAIEEISPDEWAEKVYKPDIIGKPNEIYKKPGYSM
ncbi:MAG: tautomerase family protein [Bdellovibrionales bacterium]|nr:tautomerase family protein [Bdellovibrionales bacterium]